MAAVPMHTINITDPTSGTTGEILNEVADGDGITCLTDEVLACFCLK